MKGNKQELFYQLLGQELTKARERKKLSVYDLARESGEQWNTITAMEKGGKFMGHHFAWMRSVLEVNLNILLTDVANQLSELEDGENKDVKEAKPKRNTNAKLNAAQAKLRAQTEEADEESGDDAEDLSSLF